VRVLSPEIIKSLSPEQLELLVELGDLAKKESELTYQIESIRKQEEKVGLARDSRQTKAIHEDTEFVDLLSLRAVREREIIRDKISGLIRSLLDAGLEDLALIVRQAPNYGVDIKRRK